MRILQENETHQVNGGVIVEAITGITVGFGTGLGFAGLFFSAAEFLTTVKVIGSCTLAGLVFSLFC